MAALGLMGVNALTVEKANSTSKNAIILDIVDFRSKSDLVVVVVVVVVVEWEMSTKSHKKRVLGIRNSLSSL